ncbi:aminotransferase class I/II-fold pyridoxal phosphate-dependent enzyme [Mesorhizobium sp. WSM4887]|uniref:aminotransferase class I/II-fold pyridoxal phosphate-dependent enzyme n=1 Tax=Mesorhizobium sp. WSM4887 TaxID=3038543 RepID=UPI002417DBC9|nr:aminotransferase class I/II-fold pyridoxal phosphate-dependent enzyme [Mesorhizobium sp. WSM4887]MDG4889794.1 aminotransferase class I/II-fold pyridoxal phosphate-dependent enzyme [Mesorhizobium sp. WSM4887]
MQTLFPEPARISRLQMPERKAQIGMSLRQGERLLEENSSRLSGLVDLTYADTKRFPAPDYAIEAFTKAATAGGLSYTAYRGGRSVREVVAANVSAFVGIEVDPDRNLILTPGTQAGLYAALSAVVEDGDKVAMMDPDYLTNERMLRYLSAHPIRIPLRWEEKQDDTIDFDALEAAFKSGARVFVFSNPNNPTGTVHSPTVIKRLAELAIRYNVFVIADQLYARLVYDNRPFLHLASVPGMAERTVTLLGPSKTESMSGYRLGLAIGPAEIVDRMEDLQSITALRAPAYAQHTLTHWLVDDRDLVAQRIQEFQSLRDLVVQKFRNTNFLTVVASGGSSYIFPRVVGLDQSDKDIALALQNKAGVIINPGFQSGPGGIGHFRICFAQEQGVLERCLDRIVSVLGDLAKR